MCVLTSVELKSKKKKKNHCKVTAESPNMWKLSSIVLNKPWVKEEISQGEF